MENLMTLVDQCDRIKEHKYDDTKAMEFVGELKSLGFKKAADIALSDIEKKAKLAKVSEYHFIKVTNDKIASFLEKKAEKYNESHHWDETKAEQSSVSNESGYFIFSSSFFGERTKPDTKAIINDKSNFTMLSRTNDYYKNGEGVIGKFEWTETPIAKYKNVPPMEVLDALKLNKSREIFDYFTVAEVAGVKDPLLFGRVKGVKDRFFIAQWGDDVNLDDVV